MKIFTTILLLLTGLVSVSQDITPRVSEALKKGDAAALASFMMPQVEIILPGEEGVYKPEDAQRILAAFLSDHGVTGFAIKHEGTSKLDDQYRIGELTTSKGNFRVTFFMKKNGNNMQIKQLKIE